MALTGSGLVCVRMSDSEMNLFIPDNVLSGSSLKCAEDQTDERAFSTHSLLYPLTISCSLEISYLGSNGSYPLFDILKLSILQMDAPKTSFSILSNSVPDILACIVFYLSGEHLGRLKITGSKLLWHLLQQPRVVKSVVLGKDFLHFKSWPAFLSELPYIEELYLTNDNLSWWSDLGVKLNLLPRTLQKLGIKLQAELKFPFDNFVSVDGKKLHLDEHLPHLTALDIVTHPSNLLDLSWLERSPPSLTRLSISDLHTVDLPASILHLSIKEYWTDPSATYHTSHLQSLDLRVISDFSKLCPSLTSLKSAQSRMHDEEVQCLPKTLTELEIGYLSPIAWPNLPRSLQSLRALFPDDYEGVSFEEAEAVKTNFELLPESLTSLCFTPIDDPDTVYYHDSLLAEMGDSIRFPPHLKKLIFLTRLFELDPCTAKRLPRTLTLLETELLTEGIMEQLPPGLTVLSAENVEMSPNLLNCIPKSVTTLCLSNKPPDIDFDSVEEDIVEFSEILIKPSPRLTTFRMNNMNGISDSFIRQNLFENLLDFGSAYFHITDLSIPYLNRHLAKLDISGNLTGKCFEYLPRGLTCLSLSFSSKIYDSDIQNLPRHLVEVVIRSAVHLTNDCIPDFPRSLEMLDICLNKNITRDCVSSLPGPLRAGDNRFRVARFALHWGKIRSKF